jgi:hypothetical protein
MLRFGCFGHPNFRIEDFKTLGHGPSMLKALNSKFCDPKHSNSILLTSWGHVPGSKSFDLDDLGSPNVQIKNFNILRHGPRMLKLLNSKFLDPKTLNPGC